MYRSRPLSFHTFRRKFPLMRASHLFGETLRHAPTDTEIVSHQLMLQAGYVRQLSAGIFSYLPLAWRSIRKIEQILREEMEAIGGQELNMPVVHPAEIWQQTGRWSAIDETMVRFKDRRDHDMVLAMTHEEIVATLAQSEIKSYRQMPQLVFQMQTKFRDEPRARGGLIRVREFIMKDSYSLDKDYDGLKAQYIRHYNAYHRIGLRCGLPLIAVGSDTGMMGGQAAHEFMYLTAIGEDTLMVDAGGTYAANQEIAVYQKARFDNGEAKELEKVHTPGCKTIDELSHQMFLPKQRLAKAVFFLGTFAGEDSKLIVAIVRGDMDANPVLIKNEIKALTLRAAAPQEIEDKGGVPGYASPIGMNRHNVIVIVDETISEETNFVAGANEAGYHYRNVNYGRDFTADFVTNIALARAGDLSIGGEPLEETRGVEVGNIFQLGTKYSAALGAMFADVDGEQKPVIMGSYGIGVGRLLACVAETHRDDKGLKLPISVAPYALTLAMLARTEETKARAETLYTALLNAGVEVIFDDRDVSAGIKFADSDLRGMPLQMVISDRSLKAESVELKRRGEEARSVPLSEAISEVQAEIAALYAELNAALETAPVWAG